MQLPIDIRALLNEATNIKAARDTNVSVSMYIDEAAPADLIAHVRSVFTSSSKSVRMTMSYLDRSFVPHEGDDFAIIVADGASLVGPAATALRAMGVPTMVVTTMPEILEGSTGKVGHAIPEGDMVSPSVELGEDCAKVVEPIALDDEAAQSLNDRMGAWIVSVCHEKRLAMAIAFPFMRRPLAVDAVQATSLQNAGIGLVPIIPGADLPIMTLNQAKMVLQIAAAYGQEMSKERAKELAAVVGSAYLCRVVARELVEFVPVLGFIIKPGVAYGGTSAVGYAAIDYFEGGKDMPGVMNVVTHATETGAKLAQTVRTMDAASVSAAVIDKVKGLRKYTPVVQSAVKEYGPKVVDLAKDVKANVSAQASAVRATAR